MAKVNFEIKVDTSEMSKAMKKLGVALDNLQKATITCYTVDPKPIWYKRFWNWVLWLFDKNAL